MRGEDVIRKTIIAILSALACLALGTCALQCWTMKAISFWDLPEEFSPPIWSSGGIGWFCLELCHVDVVDPKVVVDGKEHERPFVRTSTWAEFSIYDRAGQLHELRNVKYTMVIIPLPLLFLLFVAYPAIAFVRGLSRRYRRREEGHCLQRE
jgi:hypothetical protein